MMMLLQCPRFFRSPSRNQTPSVIFCTVSGVALELDTKKANDSINLTKKVIEMDEKMAGELLKPGMEATNVGWFRLVLESVRRVAEYGSDIAEIAIDLTAKEPNNLGK